MPHRLLPRWPALVAALLTPVAIAAASHPAAGAGGATPAPVHGHVVPPADSLTGRSSAWWLGALPDGEIKRKFILDCTGCHQITARQMQRDGAPRQHARWVADITRMLGRAGAATGFPVIAADRDAEATAAWLTQALGSLDAARTEPLAAVAALIDTTAARVTEYDMPEPRDLPHDVAIDSSGAVVITGMMSHTMYVLDPASGSMREVPLPVQRGGPRAVEIDAAGNWWVLLGGAGKIARYTPVTGEWKSWDIDMYPHSVAIAADGGIWYNGHFTRDPELMARLDPATGAVARHELPPHAALRSNGGPVPYELRIAPDGMVWMSELQGNRLMAFDPASGTTRAWEMPVTWSGPRRFDVDAQGIVWIPAYSANALVRFDPRTEQWQSWTLPLRDAVPYVVRADPVDGALWIGTSAGDALLRFEPAGERFSVVPLPSRGALVRHLTIAPGTRDVWVAYGASPGEIPARVARVQRVR